MTDESPAMDQPYEIVSVRRAEPPPGGKGSNWYRYVIAFEGTNTIHGCRQGGHQGRDEGGGGDCRPIERTAQGAQVCRGQTHPRPHSAEEENPQVTIDHP